MSYHNQLMSVRIIRIPNTIQVLCRCWAEAENSLQSEVASSSPDIDEEIITQRFHSRFTETLGDASQSRLIERSFVKDLESSFSEIDSSDLRRVARGLIADVTLHKRGTEKTTGGDLGLMIIRPQVQLNSSALKISDYRRGLLAQAKTRRVNGKWGNLTANQEQTLSERSSYLALLLYSYRDFARRELEPFRWQTCNGMALHEVKHCLKRDSFPSPSDSSSILKQLGNGTIGTDDERALDEIVSPQGNSALIIRISWPDDGHPGSQVRVYTRREQQQRQAIAIVRR